jgi:hypothetical protein
MISPDVDSNDRPVRAFTVDRLVLWAAAAAVIVLRSHVADAALEADECNYLYVASRLVAGDRLYVDVWDHQPPGVFWMFAVLCRVFGDSPATLRWTATAASLLALVLLFDGARRSYGRRAAWLTAGLFAIGHVNPLMAGEGGNREVYMNALAAAAMWSLLRRPAGVTRSALPAGVCLGLMSLLKTVAAAPWVFLALAAMSGARRKRNRMADLATIAVGPAVIWALTIGAYAATGRLRSFVDAVFQFNMSYSGGATSLWQRFADFFAAPQNQIIASQWPVWVWCAAPSVRRQALSMLASRREPTFSGRRMRPAHTLLSAFLAGSGRTTICWPGRRWSY